MANWAHVSHVMQELPGVTEGKRREWRLKDKLVAWERPLRPADIAALGAEAPTGPILAVYAPLDIKEVLLSARSEVYFTTPHFDGWPAILIRLPVIGVMELRERLRRAWLARAPKRLAAGAEDAKPLAHAKPQARPKRAARKPARTTVVKPRGA